MNLQLVKPKWYFTIINPYISRYVSVAGPHERNSYRWSSRVLDFFVAQDRQLAKDRDSPLSLQIFGKFLENLC